MRYHPQCLWQDRHKPVPALVVALRDIVSGEIASVLRIWLDQRKHWPNSERRILGPRHGVAAMFDQPKGGTLTVGVEAETCLAARELGLVPGSGNSSAASARLLSSRWSRRTGTSGIPRSPEFDAIEVCVTRWWKAGRRVRVVIPEAGGDDLIHQLVP